MKPGPKLAAIARVCGRLARLAASACRFLARKGTALARSFPWTTATLATILACAALIAWGDRPIAFALRRHLPLETFGFFKVLTDVGPAGLWYAMAAALLLGGRILAGFAIDIETHDQYMRLARGAWFILVAMATSGLAALGLRFACGRYRPRYLFLNGLYGLDPFGIHMGMYSFPSGHTQTVVAAMLALYYVYPRYNLLYILIAVLMGASRAVTTVHYVSDVLAGAFIAVAVTRVLKFLFERGGRSLRLDG